MGTLLPMAPNRTVALATAVLTLALAVLPVIGDFDWTSTAGVLAGIVAVLGVALKWLEGWQRHEANLAFDSHQIEEVLLDGADVPAERTPEAEHTGLDG